jgi:hypothetical protein
MKLQPVLFLLLASEGFAVAAPSSRAQEGVAPGVSTVAVLTNEPSPNPEIATTVPIYIRPTPKQRLHSFEFDAIGPYAFVTAIAVAGYQQHTDSPPDWGQGLDSFGARVGSNFGIGLVTVTTHYGLAAALHEDIIYYPCDCKGFFRRFGHALISTVTARRGEDGHTVLSLSGIVSPYAGTMTALAWYPDRFGVKDGFRMGNYNLTGQAAWNVGYEFIYGGPHAMFGRSHASNP